MTAVLSLGSNLGDRAARLCAGLEVIGMQLAVRAVSSVYETAPVGRSDQPAFLNLVALVETDDPERALAAAHAAEDVQGRLRSLRWGPRTLDVDVVAVDLQTRNDPRLTLPHPRAHERGFVLVPWLEVDRGAVLPGVGAVRDVLAGLDLRDIRRYAGGVTTGVG